MGGGRSLSVIDILILEFSLGTSLSACNIAEAHKVLEKIRENSMSCKNWLVDWLLVDWLLFEWFHTQYRDSFVWMSSWNWEGDVVLPNLCQPDKGCLPQINSISMALFSGLELVQRSFTLVSVKKRLQITKDEWSFTGSILFQRMEPEDRKKRKREAWNRHFKECGSYDPHSFFPYSGFPFASFPFLFWFLPSYSSALCLFSSSKKHIPYGNTQYLGCHAIRNFQEGRTSIPIEFLLIHHFCQLLPVSRSVWNGDKKLCCRLGRVWQRPERVRGLQDDIQAKEMSTGRTVCRGGLCHCCDITTRDDPMARAADVPPEEEGIPRGCTWSIQEI